MWVSTNFQSKAFLRQADIKVHETAVLVAISICCLHITCICHFSKSSTEYTNRRQALRTNRALCSCTWSVGPSVCLDATNSWKIMRQVLEMAIRYPFVASCGDNPRARN